MTKHGDIYLKPCKVDLSNSFSNISKPYHWVGCDDAYAFTWYLDQGNDITFLSHKNRELLARSAGFCPHKRCQLVGIEEIDEREVCPKGLCFTKIENGSPSFGGCCFNQGVFNSGDLIGYYNKSQSVPKPIYKHSRVVIGRAKGANEADESKQDDDDSWSRFVNANEVYPGIIATQCPLSSSSQGGAASRVSTVADVQRMIWEQRVSLWVQLSPSLSPPPPDPVQREVERQETHRVWTQEDTDEVDQIATDSNSLDSFLSTYAHRYLSTDASCRVFPLDQYLEARHDNSIRSYAAESSTHTHTHTQG